MAKGRKIRKGKATKAKTPEQKPAPTLTRDQARRSKPIAHEFVRRKELENGGAQLTFLIPARGMAKWLLRLPEKVEKTVALDAIGIEIFDLCDGHTTIDQIVRTYASKFQLDHHEAEIAVTTFMRTLVQRGLVTMMVPKK